MSHPTGHEPMDTDDDPLNDAKFWDSFRSLGTIDRDELIHQFKEFTRTKLTEDGVKFFLELANWNLQSAICAYYDNDTPELGERINQIPSMSLVADITYGDGESVTPSTRFTKTWRFQNTGTEQWPRRVEFNFVCGELIPEQKTLIVDRSIRPQESFDMNVTLTSPDKPGVYKSQFRFTTMEGMPFGDMVWAIVTVEPSGILGITQQMQNFKNFGGAGEGLNDESVPANPLLRQFSLTNAPTTPTTTTTAQTTLREDGVSEVTEGIDRVKITDEDGDLDMGE